MTPPAMLLNLNTGERLAEIYFVMTPRKGLMRRGASVWPRKTLAAALRDSAAVVPTVMLKSQPIFMTTH